MKTRVRFFNYFSLAFFVICQTETSAANEFIAMGLAEQHADKNAHDDMSAYQKSMYCTISDKNPRVNYNQTVTLPTDEYMRQLRADYTELAHKVIQQKQLLEHDFDITDILPVDAPDLYSNTMHNNIHPHMFDTAQERIQKSDSDEKIQFGITALLASTGITAGADMKTKQPHPQQDTPVQQTALENVATTVSPVQDSEHQSLGAQKASQNSVDELCEEFPDEPECSR